MAAINDNLQAVTARIQNAAKAAGRDPATVRLLAVSKTQPHDAILQAYAAGQRSFGENYVQEALEKQAALTEGVKTGVQSSVQALPKALTPGKLEWHLIGPLQANKTRVVAAAFDWVHSIDRAKIARRLSEARAAHAEALNVLIQVNVSGEPTKSGVAPGDVAGLAHEVAALPRLCLRGLMAIPEPTDDVEKQRVRFREIRELFDRLVGDGLVLDTLSMGMSLDLESAIAEGATMVRIGTAIFGERKIVGAVT